MEKEIVLIIVGVVIGSIFRPSLDEIGLWLKNLFSRIIKFDTEKECEEIEKLVSDNYIKNGHKKFHRDGTFLSDRNIKSKLKNYNRIQKQKIKKYWIEKVEINNYDDSNIFFAGMEIFSQQLTKNDIENIYEKFKNNNQAQLDYHFTKIKKKNPKLELLINKLVSNE